jgi:hypothetical protein
MANELQLLPNPDNTPGAVSSGYQRQNTNIFALQTGLDTTEPYDNDNGTITIPAGGIVEINGSLFKLTSTVTISKTGSAIANWIAVLDNGNGTASLTAVTRPGVWNPSKKGCYRTNGARTLNWVSFGSLSGSSGTAIFSRTTKGTGIFNAKPGWYYADLRSGLGAGDGGNASGNTGGGGGVASIFDQVTKIFFVEKPKSITIKVGGSGFNGGAGGNGNSSTGGGGGGGSGPGEASSIPELGFFTDEILGGDGGNGGNDNIGGGGGGGRAGGTGGTGVSGKGNNGGNCLGGPGYELRGGGGGDPQGTYGGGGGVGQESDGDNGTGGGGGGMGSHGKWRGISSTSAGYCGIYKLEN